MLKKVADPVAQALAVIPNPYQPYAQAYTGIRSSGVGGDYKGLQVGGLLQELMVVNMEQSI
jgi:hypothetical protein